MPFKGENQITTYFPRLGANQRLRTPVHPKLKAAKRPRQPDEVGDFPGENSRKKKSKSGRKTDVGFPSTTAELSCSTTGQTSRAVIEIRDTPPASPFRPPLPQTTPPSSPLPELTPSPEHPRRTQSPSRLYPVDSLENDPGLDAVFSLLGKANHQERDEAKLDLIPSSQTQALNDSIGEEDVEPFRAFDLPSSSIPTSNFWSIVPPQGDPSTSSPHSAPEELVASSQSQLMDHIPTSPVTSDLDLVPSSQTQIFSHSQDLRSFQNGKIAAYGQQSFLTGTHVDGVPQVAANSSSNNPFPEFQTSQTSTYPEDLERPTVIPRSQTSMCRSLSSPRHDERSQPFPSLHKCSDTGTSLQEDLPDVVKDFQNMFGETFESLPPDFPMSLRF